MDFSSFVITGPSTSTVTVGKALNGVLNGDGKKVTTATRCLYVYSYHLYLLIIFLKYHGALDK